jgi:hypothetical protein
MTHLYNENLISKLTYGELFSYSLVSGDVPDLIRDTLGGGPKGALKLVSESVA